MGFLFQAQLELLTESACSRMATRDARDGVVAHGLKMLARPKLLRKTAARRGKSCPRELEGARKACAASLGTEKDGQQTPECGYAKLESEAGHDRQSVLPAMSTRDDGGHCSCRVARGKGQRHHE